MQMLHSSTVTEVLESMLFKLDQEQKVTWSFCWRMMLTLRKPSRRMMMRVTDVMIRTLWKTISAKSEEGLLLRGWNRKWITWS